MNKRQVLKQFSQEETKKFTHSICDEKNDGWCDDSLFIFSLVWLHVYIGKSYPLTQYAMRIFMDDATVMIAFHETHWMIRMEVFLDKIEQGRKNAWYRQWRSSQFMCGSLPLEMFYDCFIATLYVNWFKSLLHSCLFVHTYPTA